jgi:hypothetical protein
LHPRDFERKFDGLCATGGIDRRDADNEAGFAACIGHWAEGQVEPLDWCRIQCSQCEADFPEAKMLLQVARRGVVLVQLDADMLI